MPRRNHCECLLLCFVLTIFAGLNHALSFTKQPNNTSILDGSESVNLDCVVDDETPITWFKNNKQIKEDFTKYTFTSRGLRIKPVRKSDAGVYYCQAGGFKSSLATLTVEYICKNAFPLTISGAAFRGEDFTMTCNCPAIPDPTYQWRKDDTPIPSATSKELVITNAETNKDNGDYVCIVSSRKRTAKSLPHNLSVHNCSPAKIISPPDKQTPFVVKKPLTVNCNAVGDPTPVVKWYKGLSDTPLKNSSRHHILPNGALHFTNMQADDVGDYKCYAANSCHDSKTYTSKFVEATTGKFIPMKNKLQAVGSTFLITCKPPSDAIPAIRNVTWQKGDASQLSNDSRFQVNGNTLTIEKLEMRDSGKYTCVAKNMAGTTTVDVKLTVAIYPKKTQDPVDTTVIEGETVKLKCNFSGDPRPKITWEKNQNDLPDNTNTEVTYYGDESVLTIKGAKGYQSGKYRCSATLGHIFERTEEASLLVKEKIQIVKSSTNKFNLGTNGRLTCIITAGHEPIHVHWEKEGFDKLPLHIKTSKTKLLMNNVDFTDSGNYTCHVSNAFSNQSRTFNVHIYNFTRIILAPNNVTVIENGSAMLNCLATGVPKPKILWYRYKGITTLIDVTAHNSRFKMFPNGSLLLTNVTKEDESYYSCMAGNPGLIQEEGANVKVLTREDLGKTATNLKVLTREDLKSTPTATSKKPKDLDDEDKSDKMGKTVGIAVGCAGAYIILVVGLMIYCKGRRARQAKNKLIVNGEDTPLKPNDDIETNVEVVKAFEPSTAKQFPRANLETLRTLGSGTYGNVFLAKASEIVEGESSSIVVVQSLTSDDEDVKKDYMRRMEMFSLKHKNIAKLLGVCQEAGPMYLISEYPEQGDLKTVMRDSSTPLSPTQKLNICAAVASGMNYLSNHGHVHKDLAARNCLVNKAFDVKISFLSLNQGTYPKEYYKRGNELIPLRWMAPEALNGDLSDMSDVWSFGIVMWEVYTEGILPYEERSDEEVLKCVSNDLRLTKPEGCPGKIYKMMEKCWADDKEDRLTFGQICEDISEIPRESEF